MALTDSASWQPSGVESLESAAEEVVRSTENLFVVAGPGAGKTELLAQRACYLLQTGACPTPKRILAISFKRNSAKALMDRVKSRCGEDLSPRFDSMTFDAFAKGLLDRFLNGVPEAFRPSRDYEIKSVTDRDWEEFKNQMSGSTSVALIASVSGRDFKEKHVFAYALDGYPEGRLNQVAIACWKHLVRGSGKSTLDFPMISRLSEFLVRSNPMIRRALRMSYSHVLLDEFQDTTLVQLDLVKAIFLGSSAVLTAVGDHKQRIMGFAMALPKAFEVFAQTFDAERRDLVLNYRSAPELVRIQHYIALSLDPNSTQVASKAKATEGSCAVLNFNDEAHETAAVAWLIDKFLGETGIDLADVCVLVKQKVADFGPALAQALTKRGIDSLHDAEHIDLLSEPIVELCRPFLRLAIFRNAPQDWTDAMNVLNMVDGVNYDESDQTELDGRLEEIVKTLRKLPLETPEDANQFVNGTLEQIGVDRLRKLHPEYSRDNDYARAVDLFNSKFGECVKSASTAKEALRNFLGLDCVQIMTIHKSKGLEFDTMFFVGLEDSSWWNFTAQPSEEKSAFFVALSRAKKRAVFTYCGTRPSNARFPQQSKTKIKPLYDLLAEAGVPSFDIQTKNDCETVFEHLNAPTLV